MSIYDIWPSQILEALGIDYIDESEVLTPADEDHHINKGKFTVPFVNGAKDLGEALRRINEGACMIRTKVRIVGCWRVCVCGATDHLNPK
jgi:pyridoxal biosynthesis lyase PdxS